MTRLIFAFFLVLAMAAGVNAQSMPDTRLIDLIQNRYEQTQAFDSTFEQTLTHKESGAQEKRQGKLLFQKPLRIRWETRKPHEETLVVTDKEIWDYLPDEEIAYRYSPELIKDSRNIIQVVTGQAALNRDFDVKNDGRENGLVKLLLYPREPSPQLVEAAIWVDPDTGFIRRARIIDFYGNGNEVKFGKFAPRESISPSQFAFTPPKGIEVEDRMEKGLQERELFK